MAWEGLGEVVVVGALEEMVGGAGEVKGERAKGEEVAKVKEDGVMGEGVKEEGGTGREALGEVEEVKGEGG